MHDSINGAKKHVQKIYHHSKMDFSLNLVSKVEACQSKHESRNNKRNKLNSHTNYGSVHARIDDPSRSRVVTGLKPHCIFKLLIKKLN